MQGQGSFRRQNSTMVSSFVLTAYVDPGFLRWLFFLTLLLLYLLMIFSNLLLLCVIALSRSLHEPMYMFLCSLLINELFGSAALLPFLLVHILRDVHIVSATFCFFQIFVIHGYGTTELLTLASMSYDRYMAICCPLHYRTRMSRSLTATLIILPWSYAFGAIAVTVHLTSSLKLCGNVIDKVYCDNYSTVKLSCHSTTDINITGIVGTVALVAFSSTMISYTYFRILKVCWGGAGRTRGKALNTCVPHLTSILNFVIAGFFELFQSRFDMRHVPNMLRIFLSLYFLLCPPLFNPIMYGLVLTNIRLNCKGLLLRVFRRGS